MKYSFERPERHTHGVQLKKKGVSRLFLLTLKNNSTITPDNTSVLLSSTQVKNGTSNDEERHGNDLPFPSPSLGRGVLNRLSSLRQKGVLCLCRKFQNTEIHPNLTQPPISTTPITVNRRIVI